MISLQPTTKTLICIGTGGVGKTTLAASLGVGFANSGKKVLVLTIDPSLRLAQALGIKTDGELQRVQLNNNSIGELWSCVIDHQKTFDWFIRHASQNADVEGLLQNKLYKQLSGRLSGSQEFTSLISLFRFSTSNDYDLIILDTPPSQHTWSFLQAPEKIAALFNEGVASWFRQTGSEKKTVLKKVLNLGTTQVLKALEILTGAPFMRELSAFFMAIQKWQGPLETYVMDCHRLLTSPQTEFVLVTTLDPSRLTEAQKLSREIQKQGYKLTSVIINRIPLWTHLEKNKGSYRVTELINYYESLEKNLQNRLNQFKNGLKVYKCFDLRQNSDDVQALQKNFNHIIPID